MRMLIVISIIFLLVAVASAIAGAQQPTETRMHVTYTADGVALHQPAETELCPVVDPDERRVYMGGVEMDLVFATDGVVVATDCIYIHTIYNSNMTDKELAEKVVRSWELKRKYSTTGLTMFFREYTQLDKEIDEECRQRAQLPAVVKQITMFHNQ